MPGWEVTGPIIAATLSTVAALSSAFGPFLVRKLEGPPPDIAGAASNARAVAESLGRTQNALDRQLTTISERTVSSDTKLDEVLSRIRS